jgi:hypothetical protein
MKPIRFKLVLEGEIMSSETINVAVTVNPASPAPLSLTDVNGNNLPDGADVTLTAETVGVNDPGQVVCNIAGGQAPYTATISSGAAPDGMELNLVNGNSVELEGTPTTAGDDEFAVTVSDSAGASLTVGAKSKKRVG